MARFWAWFATGLSVISLGLTWLAMIVPDWIEKFFEASPDGGGGETEAGLAVGFLAAAVVSAVAAMVAWRRVREAGATSLGA